MSSVTTSLLDLINANLLSPGTKVMVRDVEGELTPQGTIISTTEKGTIEYKTPTAFSKAVTNSTSGGWHQVKLKNSGGNQSLFSVKREFSGFKPTKRGGKTPKQPVAKIPGHIPGHAPGPAAAEHARAMALEKLNSSHIDEDSDNEGGDHDEVMHDSDPDSPPTPPTSSTSTPPPPPRSTMIAKHTKQFSPEGVMPGKSAPPTSPIIMRDAEQRSERSERSERNERNAQAKRPVKDVELLVHIESIDAIPYEVTGVVDSYEALQKRISAVIPEFPFSQAHEMGVYSEYWEKHAGVAYVKPPKNWLDFPACTTILLKKIPETIIINNL